MAPESAPPPAAEETPKIRLRPKLSAPTPAPEPAAEPVAEEAVPPPPEESESPPPAPPVDPTAGGEFPKFKLKFKPGGGSAAPMEQAPAPLPEEIPPPGEQLEPGAEVAEEPPPEDGGATIPPRPKTVQLRLSEDQLPPLEPGEVKIPKPPAPRKAITAGVLAVVAAFLVVFGASAYFTSRMRSMAPPPPPPKPVVTVAPKPVEAEPAKEPVEAEPVVKKAPAVVKKAPPPKPLTAPAAATTSLGGGVSATTSDDVAAATDASPAFRSWVAGAKIGGVFQGASPRVLINGRTVRVGTTVDEGLTIVFDSLDAENKMIIFKDSTGAIVSRHY